jgi:DHA1 family inner membrane transport protein
MDTRLFWLAVAAFVGAVEGGSMASMLPMISGELGVSIGQAGLLVVGHGIAYAIGPPLIAVFLGGVGRRRILAWAQLGIGTGALLMAVMPVFDWLIGIRALVAICTGTFTGTAFAVAATIAPPGQRGQSMQVIATGRSFASLAGVPLAALVATQLDWRLVYWGLGALGFAAALALYVMLPRGMHGDTQTMRERLRVLRNPGVVPMLITTVLFMVGAIAASIYIAAILRGAGIDLGYLPLVLLAAGVGSLVASLSAGRIADRVGNRATAIAAAVTVIGTLTALAALPLLPEAFRLAALLATLGIGGYAVLAYTIATGSELAHLAPNAVPVAISLNQSAFSIAAAGAAAIGGATVDTWGPSVLALGGIVPVAVALAVWIVSPRRPPPSAPDERPDQIEPPGEVSCSAAAPGRHWRTAPALLGWTQGFAGGGAAAQTSGECTLRMMTMGLAAAGLVVLLPTVAAGQEALSAHNALRAKHGVPPLSWSGSLAATAQDWANRCVFEHSNNGGENLATGTTGAYSQAQFVRDWYSEIASYDFASGTSKGGDIGHFTQVVWKSTTQVGCGIASCADGNDLFVCNYSPAGNWDGQYIENVPPAQ